MLADAKFLVSTRIEVSSIINTEGSAGFNKVSNKEYTMLPHKLLLFSDA